MCALNCSEQLTVSVGLVEESGTLVYFIFCMQVFQKLCSGCHLRHAVNVIHLTNITCYQGYPYSVSLCWLFPPIIPC
jgi:hypothetical protein